MGLLAALDFHQELQSDNSKNGIEVEYHLCSWGEICIPFLGNPEHSLAARHILNDFPFKLFSSSVPTGPLPQKLCLTFRPPDERRGTEQTTIFGQFPDEIAKEFAAFLSLITRRRVFVAKQSRYDGLPIEQTVNIYQRSHFQEAQRHKEIEPREIYQLLENLRLLDRTIAESFVLAMRLYHTAVEMMFTEPEFSYLLLVTCLETISSVVNKDYRPSDIEGFLNSRYSGWKCIDKNLQEQSDKEKLQDILLRNEQYTFRKLYEFISKSVPDVFYTDTEDDAKPDYYTSIVGINGQSIERSEKTIQQWEKIEKISLEKVLRSIYDARSKLVHEGVRLPSSIILGLFKMIPVEVTAEMFNPEWSPKIPPLLTFERLVSYAMTEFLSKQSGTTVKTL